jgi:hypothetical protein
MIEIDYNMHGYKDYLLSVGYPFLTDSGGFSDFFDGIRLFGFNQV